MESPRCLLGIGFWCIRDIRTFVVAASFMWSIERFEIPLPRHEAAAYCLCFLKELSCCLVNRLAMKIFCEHSPQALLARIALCILV